jgi:hypothetical protein
MHEGIAHQGQDRKKMKSSGEAPSVSGEIGSEAEQPKGFEIGADRVGVSKQEEQLRGQVAEKEKQRDSLLKAYSREFKAYAAKRAEREAAMATLESQRLSGKSNVTEAQMEAFRANDEKLNAEDLYHAEAYKRDAVDLEKDIDRLKDEIEKGMN